MWIRSATAKRGSRSVAKTIRRAQRPMSCCCRTRSICANRFSPSATVHKRSNVWRNGSLIQDLKTTVNHAPGRDVVKAHPVELAGGSRLTEILAKAGEDAIQVNSSHHQAMRVIGDNLRVSAVSPLDGVIEAVELDAKNHFVVGVQWHPERTYVQSAFSRAIFSEFVRAADSWQPPQVDGQES